jgi:hypothetical protein
LELEDVTAAFDMTRLSESELMHQRRHEEAKAQREAAIAEQNIDPAKKSFVDPLNPFGMLANANDEDSEDDNEESESEIESDEKVGSGSEEGELTNVFKSKSKKEKKRSNSQDGSDADTDTFVPPGIKNPLDSPAPVSDHTPPQQPAASAMGAFQSMGKYMVNTFSSSKDNSSQDKQELMKKKWRRGSK